MQKMTNEKWMQVDKNTYKAKLFSVSHGEQEFKVAGTLDGFIDLATPRGTYQLSMLEAEDLAEALGKSAADVKASCLHDNDALLEK
jgi:hypothetical protein